MSGNSTSQGGRFYDPAAGRFVSQDPIGLDAGDLNVYRYVENNPVNGIDPSGEAKHSGEVEYFGYVNVFPTEFDEADVYIQGTRKNYCWSSREHFSHLAGHIFWYEPGKPSYKTMVARLLPTLSGPSMRTLVSIRDINDAVESDDIYVFNTKKEVTKSINYWWADKTKVLDDLDPYEGEGIAGNIFAYFGNLVSEAVALVTKNACKAISTITGVDVCKIFEKLGGCVDFAKELYSSTMGIVGAFLTGGSKIVSTIFDGIMEGFGLVDFNTIVDVLGKWLGFEAGRLQEAFGKLVEFFTTGNIQAIVEPVLKFFQISVDSLVTIIRDILPGSDKVLLPLFSVLDVLISEGADEAGKFVLDLIDDSVDSITSFITDLPNSIQEHLGKAMKDLLPLAIKGLIGSFATGPFGIFFKMLDSIGDLCHEGIEFISSVGKAVRSAADGDAGGLPQTILKGVQLAFKTVLDLLAKLLGLDKLKDPVVAARDAAKKAIKDLLKGILDKIMGTLTTNGEKKSPEEKDGTGLSWTGNFKSGGEYKLYLAKDGMLHISWNPDCTAEQLDQVVQEVAEFRAIATMTPEELTKGVGPRVKRITSIVKKIQEQINTYSRAEDKLELQSGWKCPRNGLFVGEKCNSDFIPCDRDALGIGKNDRIPFKDGYPDFTKWKVGENIFVEGLCGTLDDMDLIYDKLKGGIYGSTPHAVEISLRNAKLTPHHAGGNKVQLIKYALHQGIRHTGGAWQLRNEEKGKCKNTK